MTAAAVVAVVVPAMPAAAGTAAASYYVAQINSARSSRGEPPLAFNGQLAGVGQAWANHMAASGSLSHNPNLASQAPPGWTFLAENVGMGPNDPAIESNFAASPEHYNNMVDPRASQVGVGEASGGGSLWVVEDFWGNGSSGAPPPPPRPYVPPRYLGPPAPPPPPPPPPAPVVAAGGPAVPLPAAAAAPTTTLPAVDLGAAAQEAQYLDTWD